MKKNDKYIPGYDSLTEPMKKALMQKKKSKRKLTEAEFREMLLSLSSEIVREEK